MRCAKISTMWTPDINAVDQLKHIIKGTLSRNNQERNLANEALVQAKQNPEIENYLFYILINDESTTSDVRSSAGIMLKNSILRHKQSDRQYILDNIVNGLMSKESSVKNITGNVITSLFSIYGLEKWPQALSNLMELINSSNDATFKIQEAAMSAMTKICEDSYFKLDCEFNGERPLEFLLDNFIKLLNHSSGKIRSLAIECIDYFIPAKSQSIIVCLDVFLSKIFELSADTNDDVKKNICKSFQYILDARGDKLLPHLDGVINYCLHLMNDQNEDVALEACEFLLALSTSNEAETNLNIFKSNLSNILPVLLTKMVYSEEEIFFMSLVDDKDDTDVADSQQDIKPSNAKSKSAHKAASKAERAQRSVDSDDESDFDEDDEDDMELDQWSIRKCSAATLDILSLALPEDVLHVVLPLLQQNIVSDQWPVREAAILAFGAISKSCIELSRDKLPTLVPFLVDRLKDDEPRVRQITCWTISRYSSWVAEEAHEGGQYANYFDPTFQSILKCGLDQKKVVQEAASSALSSFIEQSDSDLIAYYLQPLLTHFQKCFEIYQRKNLIILYDCVQTFVESMGYDRLLKKEYIDILLPPLLSKWSILDDNDNDLWPLLECMASIAATLCENFGPYAIPVYERAIKILSNSVELNLQSLVDPTIEAPEKDFIVTSLDLIDGLIQGFGYHSIELIKQSNVNLMALVIKCFEDENDDVRQSSYALLGDLAIFLIDLIIPDLPNLFIYIGNEINNKNFNSYPVVNNAIWSLGEILMRLQYHQFKDFLGNLIDLLIPLLKSMDTQQTVLENVAICIGRSGINGGGEIVSAKLSEFIIQWCSQMMYLVDNEEKETAFQGMLNIIAMNPDQGFGGLSNSQGKKALSIFIATIANYMSPSDSLRNSFQELLDGYKQLLGSEFGGVIGQVDRESRGQLMEMYRV